MKRSSLSRIEPGTQFSRLTYQRSFVERKWNANVTMGEFRCSCDNRIHVANLSHVANGRIRSCGCLRNEAASESRKRYNKSMATHGMTRTRLHIKWMSMRQRCNDPGCGNYKNYGGRGIVVCEEWGRSFEKFREWSMSMGWTDDSDLSIERIDVNGPYSPGNCKLIPMGQQAANQTTNRKLTAFGETKNVADWAKDERCRVELSTLYKRLSYGFDDEKAISLPLLTNCEHDAFGEKRNLKEWSKDSRCKVGAELLKERVYRGWSVERAMVTPPRNLRRATNG